MGPAPLLAIEEIAIAVFFKGGRAQKRRLFFRVAVATAQVIEANVRNDPIDPCVESAFEAEPVQVAIDLQKRFLIDVSSILGAAQHIEREPQDLPVVALHEQFESRTVAGLRALNKRPVDRKST